MRASETLYKAGDKSFADDYRALTKDEDTDVVIQAMLTMNILKVPDVAHDREGRDGRQQSARRAVRRRPNSESAATLDGAAVAAVRR